jgi:hypothetical protein
MSALGLGIELGVLDAVGFPYNITHLGQQSGRAEPCLLVMACLLVTIRASKWALIRAAYMSDVSNNDMIFTLISGGTYCVPSEHSHRRLFWRCAYWRSAARPCHAAC